MYGLLLENLSEYVKTVYGDEKWEEIRKEAGISSPSFGVHDDYDENLLTHLASIAQKVSSKLFFIVIFFRWFFLISLGWPDVSFSQKFFFQFVKKKVNLFKINNVNSTHPNPKDFG